MNTWSDIPFARQDHRGLIWWYLSLASAASGPEQ